MEGVLMLEGMEISDMPFQKELIQAKLIQEILCKDVILLPRFASNLLNNMFNVNLSKGLLVDGNEYIEFKSAIDRKIIRRLNEGNDSADIGFISIDFLDRNVKRRILSKHSQLKLSEGFKGYILVLQMVNCILLQKKTRSSNLNSSLEPQNVSRAVWT